MRIIRHILLKCVLTVHFLLSASVLAGSGDLLSIKKAIVDQNGDFIPDRMKEFVTVRGLITSPNFTESKKLSYTIQDLSGAITIYSATFCKSLNLGDLVQVSGAVWQFKGKTELVIPDSNYIAVVSAGNAIPGERHLTISDCVENMENCLIRLENVQLVNPENWPAEGADCNLLICDGTQKMMIRIDKNTELDGWTPPQGRFSVIGILDQFTLSDPQNNGYQIKPRFISDFIFSSIQETN